MNAIASRVAAVLALALAAHRAAAAQDSGDPHGFLADLHYRCIGPTRGGRVTAVAGVPSRPGTFYMGASGGGVWKSTDYGEHWQNVSDGYFETGSIGAIRVAPSNPDVVWVGTGSDGLRSNVISGRGVYRSTDGGATWQHVGLRDAGQIGAVEVHPSDPEVAFVAAIGNAFAPNEERGVFRTRDGGKTWTKVLFVSPTCGFADLELNTANPDEIYACAWHAQRKPWTIVSGGTEGGVYKSSDGGDSWKKLGGGLPEGVVGKSDLAVSFADPNRIYVLVEARENAGVYRSDDRGESFRLVSDDAGLLDRPFYYCNIDADPTDADVVYVCATSFYQSTDGGGSWRRLRTPHGDNHDLWIDPENPDVMIQSNDGGANVTRDGGRNWSTQLNQPTAELYSCAVDDRWPYSVYSGQQDASTVKVASAPTGGGRFRGFGGGAAEAERNWESVGGCETGPAVPKPGDADIVYAACKGCFGVYNARTGQEQNYWVGATNMYGHNPADLRYRFQRVAPIHVSPHDPNTVYHGSQYVHRTTNGGKDWETISPDLTAFEPDKQVASGEPITRDITGEEFYSTLYAIAESPVQRGVIWAGANDGPVHVTRDDGATWTDVTPPDLPPGGRVNAIEASPHQAGKAYVAVLRYLLGDFRPYVYRTEDFGRSWTRLTSGDNGVPADAPTRVVREDPVRPGLLFLGTEFGMFFSNDDGASWRSLQRDLPVTPVTDLAIHRDDLVLSTMGRGFWILDDVARLRQLDPQLAERPLRLFEPRTAYRSRARRSGGAGVPEYAAGGATIDYWLREPAADLVLEVVDTGGEVVQTFRSGGGARDADGARDGGDRPRGGRGGFGGFGRGGRGGPPQQLAGGAGAHRLVWDLRRANGRLAVPGSYALRLRDGDRVDTATLTVALDPRVAAEGVTAEDIAAQEALVARVGEVSARASQLEREVGQRRRALRDQLEADGPDGDAARAADAALAAVEARLQTDRGRYPQPMLVAQLRYLAGMIDGADQRPGRDAFERLAELEAQLGECQRALEAVAGGR